MCSLQHEAGPAEEERGKPLSCWKTHLQDRGGRGNWPDPRRPAAFTAELCSSFQSHFSLLAGSDEINLFWASWLHSKGEGKCINKTYGTRLSALGVAANLLDPRWDAPRPEMLCQVQEPRLDLWQTHSLTNRCHLRHVWLFTVSSEPWEGNPAGGRIQS